MRLMFDSTPCSRCAGEGVVRPWGTCFRCGGAKVFLTAAGKRARAKWERFRDETLSLAVGPELVGRDVLVPTQFAGPQGGGQFLTFRGGRRVVSVERVTVGGQWRDNVTGEWHPMPDQWRVGVRQRANPGTPWIEYDRDAQVMYLSLALDARLYRQATADEMRAVAPTLGTGATLVEDAPAATPTAG